MTILIYLENWLVQAERVKLNNVQWGNDTPLNIQVFLAWYNLRKQNG